MITLKSSGSFKNTEQFLKGAYGKNYRSILEKYGQQGVSALSAATPVDTGETASSWGYEIIQNENSLSINWTNSHIVKGINIAVILQYGHGTRNGGYVAGRDYINPAIRPIFDKISQELWREVRRA